MNVSQNGDDSLALITGNEIIQVNVRFVRSFGLDLFKFQGESEEIELFRIVLHDKDRRTDPDQDSAVDTRDGTFEGRVLDYRHNTVQTYHIVDLIFDVFEGDHFLASLPQLLLNFTKEEIEVEGVQKPFVPNVEDSGKMIFIK